MSAHGFKSVYMAASVVGAALACYLVSLNVASERAKLEDVEEKIVLAQRDIRVLQTEIGTRGRLAQLERWNARFIRLSAPSADQFVEGGFQLAAMVRPNRRLAIEAPVVLAAAPVGEVIPRPVATSDADDTPSPAVASRGDAPELLHTASYAKPEALSVRKPARTLAPVTAKPAKSAAADPLAPLPGPAASAKGGAPQASPATAKDNGPAR
jgi:hypothetical protein